MDFGQTKISWNWFIWFHEFFLAPLFFHARPCMSLLTYTNLFCVSHVALNWIRRRVDIYTCERQMEVFSSFTKNWLFFWVSAPLLLSQMRSGILWSFQFMSVRIIIVRFWNEKEEVVERGYVVHEKLERCVSHVDFYIFSIGIKNFFENWLKYFWRSLFFTKWILIMMLYSTFDFT